MAEWIAPAGPLGRSVAALGVHADATTGVDGTLLTAALSALVRDGVVVAVGASGVEVPGVTVVAGDEGLRRWVRRLGPRLGIGPGLVAVAVGDAGAPDLERVPRLRLARCVDPGEVLDLLGELHRYHHEAAVPSLDLDPTWVVPLPWAGTTLARVDESLATVADGSVGTRGSLEEGGPEVHELVLVNGAWTEGPDPVGLPAPGWTRVDLDPAPAPGRRWFDCRTGLVWRVVTNGPPMESVRFASLARPGTQVLRVRGPVRGDGGDCVHAPDDADRFDVLGGGGATGGWCATRSGPTVVAAVGHQDVQRHGAAVTRFDRVVVLRVGSDPITAETTARAALAPAVEAGVDVLVAEQRRTWATQWQDADVRILGDDDLTLAVRFAIHHLIASTADRGEAAVGARGLSGDAYAGHVFWDADVFVLPPLAAIAPPRAEAMLAYRLDRLPAARARAADAGLGGAWFPWESAASGEDVTPGSVVDPDGQQVPVLTGRHAVHIGADVAWAAVRYATWTGDSDWLAGPGSRLVIEPARFWASRVSEDPDGSVHLREVMGPDEYHGPVDDDCYTNALARWNLRMAAELVAGDRDPAVRRERDRWLDLARRLVVLADPATGRHEQFAGFDALEPLVISTLTEVPVAADVLLGRERVAASQVVKQPDVLMAHHVLPDELAPGSLGPDLDHEGPRLAHGSSLSPAIVAGLLARAGRPDEAVDLFRMAARLDLDDITGTTAGGLHLATMGGVWQALVGGFAGVDATPDALVVAPRLPSAWRGVDVTVRFRGVRVRVEARHDHVTVVTDAPVPVRLGTAAEPILVDGRERVALRPPTPTEVSP